MAGGVDRLRQRQVLRNLISNARKYGGPQIRLEGSRQGQWYVWIIADNGDGVPAGSEGEILRRGARADTASTGHGLGLSIVRRIVERLGGNVGVVSDTGHGSTFYFTIPIVI